MSPTNLEQSETANNRSFKNSGSSRKFENKGSKIKFENSRPVEISHLGQLTRKIVRLKSLKMSRNTKTGRGG